MLQGNEDGQSPEEWLNWMDVFSDFEVLGLKTATRRRWVYSYKCLLNVQMIRLHLFDDFIYRLHTGRQSFGFLNAF